MNGLQRRVILYGNTLILEGVRTNLKNHPELEIIVLDQPLEKPLNVLGSYCPAVLIFDMGAIQPDSLLSPLQKPDLLIIGIDPETHQALVWSGRQASAVEAADLIDVIRTDSLQNEKSNKI